MNIVNMKFCQRCLEKERKIGFAIGVLEGLAISCPEWKERAEKALEELKR